MRLLYDAAFDRECAAFELRFRCADCAFFAATEAVCAHGWPTAAQPQTDRPPDPCKEFELP